MERDLIRSIWEQNEYMYSICSPSGLLGIPIVSVPGVPDDTVYLIDTNPEIFRLPKNNVGFGRADFFTVPGDPLDMDNYYKAFRISQRPLPIKWVDEPLPLSPVPTVLELEYQAKLNAALPPIIVESGVLPDLKISFEPGSICLIGEDKETEPEPYKVDWVHGVVAALAGAAWGLILMCL